MHSHHFFSAEERQTLLQSYFDLTVQVADLAAAAYRLHCENPKAKAQIQRLERQAKEKNLMRGRIGRQYKAGVPVIPLSRCPYCRFVNYHSIDYYDLDGLWWASSIPKELFRIGETALRPRDRHQLCPHFWMLSGAVHLDQTLTVAPITVAPGPEVPFVVPRLLRQHSMRAVISSIPVGRHTAYPIVYYSLVKPVRINHPFNEWSNNNTGWVQDNGKAQTIEAVYKPYYFDEAALKIVDDVDFNLASWIEAGQVFWINPGDESLTLQQEVDKCPYLNLPGRREMLYIRRGECEAAT